MNVLLPKQSVIIIPQANVDLLDIYFFSHLSSSTVTSLEHNSLRRQWEAFVL